MEKWRDDGSPRPLPCGIGRVVGGVRQRARRVNFGCNTVGTLRAGNLTPQSVGLSPTAMSNFIISLIMRLIIAPRFSH